MNMTTGIQNSQLFVFVIASLDKPSDITATYHISALTPFRDNETLPVLPLRKRGLQSKHFVGSRTDQALQSASESASKIAQLA
ncbi:hypothetical protein CEXT_360381 [Caerostris extrusa]|uniref:Uncharacterized protein n=1 Tax=Caerostris extrusa TaxID=172846 RepID=A0AAV4TZY0_CAEEX|nr:hypothetical protein CEXT_360381 [Caerostris extrusa]